jgi:WD40 repeat protein/tRNA A-37 threonylcarbamoyl transferase component Bud32
MPLLTCAQCHAALAETDRSCPVCQAAVTILHGKYQIIRVLGRGGFGLVQEAVDRTLMRRCAIKIIEPGVLNPAQIQGEVEVLVRHADQLRFIPNVYEQWQEAGRHYIAMQYISGRTLDQIEPKPWSAAEVEHFLRVMLENLAQLHDAEIIHRDIKPVNIKRTDEGLYVLLDFGIAKRGIEAQSIKAMTLDYAPLEQLQPRRRTDQRSDLYSLAATAYQLLTNQLPPQAVERPGKTLPLPNELVPRVPPQLERAIVRMLALEPDDRPDDARAALALLDQSAVSAASEPATEQATQLTEDHAEAELALLGNGRLYDVAWAPDHRQIIAAAATGVYRYNLEAPADQPARRFEQPIRWVVTAPDQPAVLAVSRTNAQMLRLTESAPIKTLCSFPAPIILATADLTLQRLAVAAESFVQIWRISGATAAPICQHVIDDHCRALTFAPNSRLLAAALGGSVNIWNANDGQIRLRLAISRGPVTDLAFSADGAFLATLSSASVQIWRTSDGQLLQTIEATGKRTLKVHFIPNTPLLIVVCEGILQLWRGVDGELVYSVDTLPSPAIDSALSPDGAYLAVAFARGLMLFRTAEAMLAGKPADIKLPPRWLRFSHDGKMLAAWSEAGIDWLAVPDGRALILASKHSARLNSIAYSPDGQSIALMDGEVRLWERDTAGWQARKLIEGHTSKLNGLAITADGATLAAASSAGVTLWSLHDNQPIGQLACVPAQSNTIAFTPERQLVIITEECQVWEIGTGSLLRSYAYPDDISDMTISTDGRLFVILCEDRIELFNTDSDSPSTQFALPDLSQSDDDSRIQGIASAADGSLLALISDDSVIIWSVERRTPIATINRAAQRAIFAADGQHVALIHDTTLSIWTLDSTTQPTYECLGHAEMISDAVFSPDGQQIASASHDGTIRIWNCS